MVFEKERKKCICVPVSDIFWLLLLFMPFQIDTFSLGDEFFFFFFFSYMQFEIVIHVQLFSLKGQSS